MVTLFSYVCKKYLYNYFVICTIYGYICPYKKHKKMGRIYNDTRITKYRIKELCQKRGKAYSELASALSVSVQTVYNWCNISPESPTSIPGDLLIKIAHFFNTTVEKLHTPEHYKSLKIVAA